MAKSMREAFREHHRLSAEEAKAVWDSCLFVLDTNVLLNIYRYAAPTREDLFRVLRHLGTRIWVPYQVGKEFYSRRLEVIREQSAKFEQLSRSVSSALVGLNDGAFRKSGFLKIAQLEEMLRPAVDQAVKFIDDQRAIHPDLLGDDPYLEVLAGIVGPAMGQEPTPEQRDAEASDAQARIDRSQPPGYKDAKKPPPDRYGDVFIWFELVRLGESAKRPIVFVTDDDKEDWWHILSGQKLGPRPELREEMRKKAGVEFGLYNPARLMELVGAELAVSVPKSSIDDARKIAEELQARNVAAHASAGPDTAGITRELRQGGSNAIFREVRAAELAVELWLSSVYPGALVKRNLGGPSDFLVTEANNHTAVEVRLVRDQRMVRAFPHRLREFGYRAFYETLAGGLDVYLLVLVSNQLELAIELAESLERFERGGPAPTLSIGFIDTSGEYVELVRRAAKST